MARPYELDRLQKAILMKNSSYRYSRLFLLISISVGYIGLILLLLSYLLEATSSLAPFYVLTFVPATFIAWMLLKSVVSHYRQVYRVLYLLFVFFIVFSIIGLLLVQNYRFNVVINVVYQALLILAARTCYRAIGRLPRRRPRKTKKKDISSIF